MQKMTINIILSITFTLLGIFTPDKTSAAIIVGGNCTLPSIQHGFLMSLNSNEQTVVQHNEKAYVNCNEGYALDGLPDVICQHGEWSTQLPDCKPKKCSIVPVPNSIIQSEASVTEPVPHEKSISISCSKGFNLNGEKTLICDYGNWSPRIPSCDPKGCTTEDVHNGILIHKGNVIISASGVAHQEKLTISCHNGYTVTTTYSQLFCNLGNWSDTFPECQPESCIPHSVLNGRVLYSGKDVIPEMKVSHGHIATVVCGSEYIIHGESALTCQYGAWSHDFPTCQPKFCSSKAVSHGHVLYLREELETPKNIDHRSSIYVNCLAGYMIIGSSVLTCSYGHWSHNFPTCIPRGCDAQTVLQGSVTYLEKRLTNVCSGLPSGMVSHNHAITITCLKGFTRRGPEILTCNFGNWTDVFPDCIPADCNVESVENGQVLTSEGRSKNVVDHSEEVSVVCDDGYQLPVNNAARKMKCYYGEWTYPFPSCVLKKCSANIVVNGKVIYDGSVVNFSNLDTLRPIQIAHNHHVAISCNEGFNLTGRSKINCMSGEWMEQFPTCQPDSCPVYNVQNGIVNLLENNIILKDWGQLVSHRMNINISCKDGHELTGAKSLKCLYGNWTGEFPVCTPKSCMVMKVKNGHESYPGSQLTSFVEHNQFVQITCDVGYKLVGSTRVKCSQGFWCSALPTCEPSQCQLEEVINGNIHVDGKKIVDCDRPVDHNTIANVSCMPGFDIHGIPKVQCLFGKWSTDFPTCEGMTCKAEPIKNGRLKVSSTGKYINSEDLIFANTLLEVECDANHNLNGSRVPIKCQMGKWTHKFPVCNEDCGLIEVEKNVQVDYRQGLIEGSVAVLTCNGDNCILQSEPAATCRNGKWNLDIKPSCDCGQ